MTNFTFDYIKPNKGERSINKIICVDVETKREQIADSEYLHTLWFGWAVYWQRYKKDKSYENWFYFEKANEFWDWALSWSYDDTRLYIIAHNAQFDMHILNALDELYSRGFYNVTHIDEYGSFISIWRNGKRTVVLLDSMNYFRMSLYDVGKKIGVEKLEMPSRDAEFTEWSTYCKNDVLITLKAITMLLDFWKENRYGNFSRTLAGCSFNLYRHRFMPRKIRLHKLPHVRTLEENSYYGGRVVVFKKGKFNDSVFYKLDVNSMYPYVMMSNPYPVHVIDYIDKEIDIELLDEYDLIRMIAEVEIETKLPYYPVRTPAGILYEKGKFITELAGPEILDAYRRGFLKKIRKAIVYKLDYIFTDYVKHLYAKRREAKARGDSFDDLFYKLLMNSLYGKFAQRNPKWEVDDSLDIPVNTYAHIRMQDGKMYIARNIAGRKEKLVGREPVWHYAPAIASYVTSYARAYLNLLFDVAGVENVYYSDTDSLIVNEQGYQNLTDFICEDQLGQLKVESIANRLEIRGKKHYVLGDEVKAAGLSKYAIKLDDNTYLDMRIEDSKTALRHGRKGCLLERYVQLHILYK